MKKEKRKCNIKYMYNTNDDVLISLWSKNLTKDIYKEHIENIISNDSYYSDELSKTDEKKVQEEVSEHIKPKNKLDFDKHVIHIYDKSWKSNRVKKIIY